MKAQHPGAATTPVPSLVPPILVIWLSMFRPCFTAPVWNHVLVLVAGAVLAPGKRTVTQVLRVMGLADDPRFGRYHEVLSRARWNARALARRLLLHVLDRLLPAGPVVVGIDDTIERRWGPQINARGIYRDPVRSTKAILQTKRWLPDRELIFVADSGFAALDLLDAVRRHVCVITRLRLDANLYKPAPARQRGQRGRTPLKGRVLPKLSAVLPSSNTGATAIRARSCLNLAGCIVHFAVDDSQVMC